MWTVSDSTWHLSFLEGRTVPSILRIRRSLEISLPIRSWKMRASSRNRGKGIQNFRTTVRHFVKSDSGTLGDFLTRLYGSADLFPDSVQESCRPYQSLNYVDCHDGLTLYDLVAYTTEDSWNCGERDGEVNIDESVMRLRKRQVKNFFCVLMLSNGTPMFQAGDEI